MTTIVCIAPQLAGWTVEVHREELAWYEEDISVYGNPCVCIYPKPAWRRADSLIVPPTEPKSWKDSWF